MGKKMIYGVGINDANYTTRTSTWTCPYFRKWKDMLCRCYSDYEIARHPPYANCYVIEEWKYFTKFKIWMETQDWEEKQLDKDLLFPNNKEYGPETCVFVSNVVNVFITEKSGQDLPVGVSKHKDRYQSRCGTLGKGQKYLGIYDTADEAHGVWLNFKLEQAKILAAQQTDDRVAKALINRYERYKDYFD
jgi:hypothetical protein